jgi:hypothetical protein
MKTFCKSLALIFLMSQSCLAANFFVRAGASAGGNGSSWSSAWNDCAAINWSSIKPGDTVYFAGGSYGQLRPPRLFSGSAAAPISFVRARVGDPGAGWNNSYDSTVTFTAPSRDVAIYMYDKCNYLTFDGRVTSGIIAKYGTGGSGKGVEIDGPASSYVNFYHIKTIGPGTITQTSDCRGWDLTPSALGTNGIGMTGVVMIDCEASESGDSSCYFASAGGCDKCLVEYCSFHGARAVNSAQYHDNEIYCGTMKNFVFRYNKVYHIGVEGLFFNDPNNTDVEVYGNLFYQGDKNRSSGRTLEFNKAGNVRIKVYNNVFVDLPIGLPMGRPEAGFSNCEFRNNIVFGCTLNTKEGWTCTNNYYSQNRTDPASISSGADPFVNKARDDFHLKAGARAIGSGLRLPAPYNVDIDGNTWGSSWDMGAYVYAVNAPQPTPTPAPTATPTPQPTATPQPSATPTPPPVAPKFQIGDRVVTIPATTNIRATPAGTLVGTQPAGSSATVNEGPQAADLNNETWQWYRFTFDSGVNGWAGDNNFEIEVPPVATPTPTPTPAPSPSPNEPTHDAWIKRLNEATESWIRANPPTPD